MLPRTFTGCHRRATFEHRWCTPRASELQMQRGSCRCSPRRGPLIPAQRASHCRCASEGKSPGKEHLLWHNIQGRPCVRCRHSPREHRSGRCCACLCSQWMECQSQVRSQHGARRRAALQITTPGPPEIPVTTSVRPRRCVWARRGDMLAKCPLSQLQRFSRYQ